jgi:hypothetical protein
MEDETGGEHVMYGREYKRIRVLENISEQTDDSPRTRTKLLARILKEQAVRIWIGIIWV